MASNQEGIATHSARGELTERHFTVNSAGLPAISHYCRQIKSKWVQIRETNKQWFVSCSCHWASHAALLRKQAKKTFTAAQKNHPFIPVILQHEASDSHSSRDLKGHPPYQIHLFPRVRVESRVIKLLGIEQLLLAGSWGHDPCPTGKRKETNVTAQCF